MPAEIHLKIKEIRTKNKLSQERFGKKIGLSGKTISSYEKGRSIPPLSVLEKLSSVYDAPLLVADKVKKEELKEKMLHIQKLLDELSYSLGNSVND